MNMLASKIRELFKGESFPPEVEAFRKRFPVTKERPNTYVIWGTWETWNTRIQHGLGTLYFSDTGKVYVPTNEHSRHPEYNSAIELARKLGLRIG